MSRQMAVISDDAVMRSVLRAVVAREGYSPALFPLDPHVVRRLAARAPAAIVLDMLLEQPALAWQMVGLIRLDRALAHTPIIICTDDASLQDEAAVLHGTGVTLLRTPCLYALSALLARLTEAHESRGAA